MQKLVIYEESTKKVIMVFELGTIISDMKILKSSGYNFKMTLDDKCVVIRNNEMFVLE